jgi:prepilin-type N-terminal cleavage/methylation domain-containing protein
VTPADSPPNVHHQASIDTVGDRGYTLVEMLIAIVLMGSIVLSIMGGMWAVVRASSQNDERAKVQAVLGAAGDQISNWGYIPCPEPPPGFVPDPSLPDLATPGYEQFGQKAASAVGWDVETVQIVDYQYWNPETRTWSDTNTIQGTDGTCNDNVNLTTSKTLQKLTIRATAPGGGYSAQIDIVKSNIGPKEVKDESAG